MRGLTVQRPSRLGPSPRLCREPHEGCRQNQQRSNRRLHSFLIHGSKSASCHSFVLLPVACNLPARPTRRCGLGLLHSTSTSTSTTTSTSVLTSTCYTHKRHTLCPDRQPTQTEIETHIASAQRPEECFQNHERRLPSAHRPSQGEGAVCPHRPDPVPPLRSLSRETARRARRPPSRCGRRQAAQQKYAPTTATLSCASCSRLSCRVR